MHRADMVLDLQYGSTGKGLIAGYLAKRVDYDTAICAFATNAGHTYKDRSRSLEVMTQQLPTGLTSPTVKTLMLGPGSLIHPATLNAELARYYHLIQDKRIMIHPQAALVEDYHRDLEIEWGLSVIGSTTKGVGAAMAERLKRGSPRYPGPNTAKTRLGRSGYFDLGKYVVTEAEWLEQLEKSESILIEGAQGFGLSMYHGFYPYTTSRDVTPWQLAADCGLPFKWASRINIIGTLRTYPIRVNNRDGSSGPCYPDQREIEWAELGLPPELTTVTKLPRRIFTFSYEQLKRALWHCGQYYKTQLFLNFCNYLNGPEEIQDMINHIVSGAHPNWNPPRVDWCGFGPDDSDVRCTREPV